ncbi:3'(2'),5'-bisphosphate nucleotidase CysQ [Thermovibrio sp.]
MERYLELALKASLFAGSEVLKVYNSGDGDFQVEKKADSSPLTLADKNSHKVVSEILSSSSLPILSEEGKSIPYSERRGWELFWLVDPLDGTKEFLKRNGEFTVNIALVREGVPIVGVVYAPALGQIYFGLKEEGAYKAEVKGGKLRTLTKLPLKREGEEVVVVASRSHINEETENFIKELEKKGRKVRRVSKGSSLKLCLVAEGSADVYPRLAPTMEWDTAAGQAVVEAAGGKVLEWGTRRALRYNKQELLNPYFVALRAGYEL